MIDYFAEEDDTKLLVKEMKKLKGGFQQGSNSRAWQNTQSNKKEVFNFSNQTDHSESMDITVCKENTNNKRRKKDEILLDLRFRPERPARKRPPTVKN